MKNLNLILLTVISLILLVSITSAQVSHPASEITAGTFAPGDFTIINNQEVFLSIKNTETNGREYGLISAGSSGGIGVGKFSIYDSTVGQSRLTIDSSGNVGIGTVNPATVLDVAGQVRVGNFATKPSCGAGNVGAFVFDTTNNKPYVCASGSVWKPLDSDFDEDGLIEWLDPNDNSFNPTCSADNGGQCYLSDTSKSALDGDLSAGNIKSGVNIFGFTGTYSGASLPPVCTDNDGGSCRITTAKKSDLDFDLSESNIKSGVNIFGVSGTLIEGLPLKSTKNCVGSTGKPHIRRDRAEAACEAYCGSAFKSRLTCTSANCCSGTKMLNWNFDTCTGSNPWTGSGNFCQNRDSSENIKCECGVD